MKSILFFAFLLGLTTATVHYVENFNDDSVFDRWTVSKHKSDLGKFIISAGKTKYDDVEDKGLKTSEDARFYGISTKFPTFTNKGKSLIVQFSVKHEQGIDCGGGYVKVFGSDVDPASFHGESPYHIMFGPDICGLATKKVHVIFSHAGKNHLVKKDIRCKDDELTHMYTLIVKPSNEYEVQIDGEKVESGSLEEDFDILPPKMIDDDSVKKPDDWVDAAEMDDPNDKKPDDWEKPKTIADSSVKKPEDWDDEMDGEWEPPQIDNPEYKGEWKPKRIPNSAYKGPWTQPQKANPEYKENKELYKYDDIAGIGIDIWQVKSGTIFDNLIITDSMDEAKKQVDGLWKPRFAAETKLKEEEEKKIEEEAKKAAEQTKDAKKDGADEDVPKDEHDEL